jgi:hypothetical protein
MDETIEDPVNEFAFRAHTIEAGELPAAPKHNYAEKINCPMFAGLNRMKEV